MVHRAGSRLVAALGAVALGLTAGCASVSSTSGALATAAPRPAWFGDDEQAVEQPAVPEGHSIGHRLAFWIPNRIFDVFDIVRARVLLGPGIGFTVRATEAVDVVLGAHTALMVGIWGPRGEPRIPWPIFPEIFAGAGISVAEATTEDGLFTPHYGTVEFGAGAMVGLVGFDVGVDPLEIVDFVVGIFTFDLMDDDF
ncbi:MAG: hypothetical protein H6825_08450 [Planctomycetes bacterium]|nr:hypothetical protein [Planctomycetota bacterium]